MFKYWLEGQVEGITLIKMSGHSMDKKLEDDKKKDKKSIYEKCSYVN